jgi:hypothetical protein
MKFPSIFKTASHQRFAIKTRYYDPIKEEIEERTSRIKKELEAEGRLAEDQKDISEVGRSTAIKGSFSAYRGIKQRESSPFNSTAMIRTLLFLGMIGSAFGYIYLGPIIFTYLSYLAFGAGAIYFSLRLTKKRKNA